MDNIMKNPAAITRGFLCLFALLASISMSYASNEMQTQLGKDKPLKVDLPLQGVTLSYEHPVRLEQVLNDAAIQNASGYFPLSAQLFDLSDSSLIQNKKQQVLALLSSLEGINSEALWVKEQIQSLNVLPRQFVELDRNVVISQLDKNPLLVAKNQATGNNQALEALHFSLYLHDRASDVLILGAIKEPIALPLIEHGQLSDYFKLMPQEVFGLSADNSIAYIIQPDGHVQVAPYAYWNQVPTYLAPGAMVFLGFDSLPSSHSTLNQDIVELLRHKVNL